MKKHLHTAAEQKGKKHAITRGTEYVTMNQFPPKLLLSIFLNIISKTSQVKTVAK